MNQSNFDLGLSSVADFLNTGARIATSAECAPCLPAQKEDAVWICGLNSSHGALSVAVVLPHEQTPPL